MKPTLATVPLKTYNSPVLAGDSRKMFRLIFNIVIMVLVLVICAAAIDYVG